jgi:methyl-accepting chemotaxis protein
MENTFQNRRKKYYVDPEFQKKFIIKFCLLVILGTVISGAIITLMSQGTVTTVFENSRLKIKSTADFIMPAVFWSSLVVIILVGLATIIVTLYASHKISGPLYRLDTDLKKVIAGDFQVKFGLRRYDQLQALAATMDEAVGVMRDALADLKDSIRQLESSFEESEKSQDPGARKEAMEKLRAVSATLSRFRT